MYKIDDLEYLIHFFNQGIAQKKLKLEERVADFENNPCEAECALLRYQILKAEHTVLGFKDSFYYLKIKAMEYDLARHHDKISIQKKPLLNEAARTLREVLEQPNDENKTIHRTLNEEIKQLDNTYEEMRRTLNEAKAEHADVLRQLKYAAWQLTQVNSNAPQRSRPLVYQAPIFAPMPVHSRNVLGENSVNTYPAGSPSIFDILGLDKNATLEACIEKLKAHTEQTLQPAVLVKQVSSQAYVDQEPLSKPILLRL